MTSPITQRPTNPDRRRRLNAGIGALTSLSIVAAAVVGFSWTAQTPEAQARSSVEDVGTPAPQTPFPVATDAPSSSSTADPSATESPAVNSQINNVVLILADDLDWGLFGQVPRLAAFRERGMTFTNHTVIDSLCCPSRVSILRGQYIHNHKVISNIEATGGGWPTFRRLGEHRDCLPVWLDNAGSTTAMFGKYMNEYPDPGKADYVPPGWDEWAVPTSRGDSYSGYDYGLNENGTVKQYGDNPYDFLNDVLNRKAQSFLRKAPDGFFMQFSTYSPHKPFATAQRHRGKHAFTRVPRTPAYNAIGINEPAWMNEFFLLPEERLRKIDKVWSERARSAETFADTVDTVLNTLRATGRDKNTLVVISSDNGYHMGEYRLPKGKRLPYDADTVVPLIMIGPGITPGSEVDDMTSSIDFAPTITELLGANSPSWVDGRSLTNFITAGKAPENWRTGALSESLGISTTRDPDWQRFNPPRYDALRTKEWLYVQYADGSKTLYNRLSDPYSLNNVIDTTDPLIVSQLKAQTDQLRVCAGPSCKVADSREILTPSDESIAAQ
ncbi:MAG: sulfatase [Candidatus Nanopelagicales bacterium]|jgi:N-acetylglucosamine-6-sulfatase|nr:sulfatase [Candidatus Nanopelagicales bacterium]